MPFKLFLTLCWIVSCGTPTAGCADHMQSLSPDPRSPLWCSAVRLSRSDSASLRPANAPHEREVGTACDSAPSPPASVSLAAAFFGLASPLHARLVALKAAVLVQRGATWVTDVLGLGYLLVVRLSRIGAAQVADPLAVGVDDHHVLVAVGLLLAAIVQGLFFRAFRPLAAALRAVDDQRGRLALPTLVPREATGVALGEEAQATQGAHQDRQQPVDPAVHPGLAQVEEATQQLLQRIGLLVDEDEQQFVLGAQQNSLSASTGTTLARLAGPGCSRWESAGEGACESG